MRVLTVIWALLLGSMMALGQAVPDLWILELEGEPAVPTVPAGTKTANEIRAAIAERRVQVRTEQLRVRAALAARQVAVLHALDTVANALVVHAPGRTAAELAAVPGVVRVHPVYEVRLLLDRALPLLAVPQAWERIGGESNAGRGVKIGIIDTGIDHEHPAFEDPSLEIPQGFPKVEKAEDRKYTNNKIIVARTYEGLLGNAGGSPRDEMGHGTAVAMAAAGLRSRGPLAEISGVAPRAWLGNYKVFTASSETTRTDVVLRAIEDAVADGMDIINLSLGTPLAPRSADSLSARVLDRAAAAGVIVVAAAGNSGPDPFTINSYASAPSAIGVGASTNDRVFGTAVILQDGGQYAATPGNGPKPENPITAPLADVASLDRTGLACEPLPSGSLEGRIALIFRGTCFFEDKLNNAQRAGAVAAIVYTDDRPVAIMSVGSATLPGVMVSNADGLAIKTRLRENPGLHATVHFRPGPLPADGNRLASFSSRGPNPDEAVKPDLIAVGSDIYTATQSWYPAGEMYDPSRYTSESGTSFAAPMVAGAAAVLKAERPGLTVEQYRSLLVNSAEPFPPGDGPVAGVQRAGAGRLHLARALQSTIAAYPTSLSFGSGSGAAELRRRLRLTNLAAERDLFTIEAIPSGEQPAPFPEVNTIALDPGASAEIGVSWSATTLPPGEYQGFLRIAGTRSPVEIRVPYWYASPTGTPAFLTVLSARTQGTVDASLRRAIYFRVTDATGIPVRNIRPEVNVVQGGGEVTEVSWMDGEIPGVWAVSVRLGKQPGRNEFRITAGGLSRSVIIVGVSNNP
ncbi:MAG: S8 family serine peptidase [Bryobacterales bacterium]|nr:S8 family serine peptidase [Bryobacteraceae bacterium]MDW8129421.1 S8 family serine peptidase [Bryobacterales bacterium]